MKADVRQGSRGIANIVIITGLPMANDQVQVQALEVKLWCP